MIVSYNDVFHAVTCLCNDILGRDTIDDATLPLYKQDLNPNTQLGLAEYFANLISSISPNVSAVSSGNVIYVERNDGIKWDVSSVYAEKNRSVHYFEFEYFEGTKVDYSLADMPHYGSARLGVDSRNSIIQSNDITFSSNGSSGYVVERVHVEELGSELEIKASSNGSIIANPRLVIRAGSQQIAAAYAPSYGNSQALLAALVGQVNASQTHEMVQKAGAVNTYYIVPKKAEYADNKLTVSYNPSSNWSLEISEPTAVLAFAQKDHEMGHTAYELSNYLGNVNNVISNRLIYQGIVIFDEDFESYPTCGSFPTLTTWQGSSGVELCNGAGRVSGSNVFISNGVSLNANETYTIDFDMTIQSGNVLFKVYESTSITPSYTQSLTSGHNTATFTPSASGGYKLSWESTAATYTLDNVVVNEIEGNKLAEVLQYQDYYPGGMAMPGRQANPTSYRYGAAGGQEKDDEIYGAGNSYTAKYWQYDPRLIRRWNPDPITYPWQSTYAVNNNNPLIYIDPDGLYGRRRAERKRNRDIKRGNDVGEVYQSGNGKRDYGYAVKEQGKNYYAHDFGKSNRGYQSTPKNNTPSVSIGQVLHDNPDIFRNAMKSAPSLEVQRELFMARFNCGRSQGAKFLGITLGIATAPVTGALALEAAPALFSSDPLWFAGVKMGISGGAQYTLKGGEVNVVGVLADGFMIPGAGDLTGAAFEYNINFRNGTTNYRSILDTKSAEDVVREAVISSIISLKLHGLNTMVGKGNYAGKALYQAPNSAGNYGLQEKTK